MDTVTWYKDHHTLCPPVDSSICFFPRIPSLVFQLFSFQALEKLAKPFPLPSIWYIFLWCCLLAKSCPSLFATPWTVARQAPLSMGFSRQEYWSGLPFPSSGNLPRPGIELTSCKLASRVFTTEPLLFPYREFPYSFQVYCLKVRLLGRFFPPCCLSRVSLCGVLVQWSSLSLSLFFWLHCAVFGILAPWPETKPMLLALEVHSLNHCTTKEVSIGGLFEVYFHILIWELSSTSVLLYQLVIRAPMVLQVLAEGKVLVQCWWMTQLLDYQPMQHTWALWLFFCQPCMRFVRLTVYCSWPYD